MNSLVYEFFKHGKYDMVTVTSRIQPAFSITRIATDADRKAAEAQTPAKTARPEKITKPAKPDFDDMTKAELIAYAEANGIEVSKSDLKAKILATVKAA